MSFYQIAAHPATEPVSYTHLGQSELLWPAVGVMGCAVGLLLALGLYVFLGARAEAALVASSQQTAHSEGAARGIRRRARTGRAG